MERKEFSLKTKNDALNRQENQCGSCGTPIYGLGYLGIEKHFYGEASEAHHMIHAQCNGSNDLSNCVILCKICHYNVHQGGNFRNHEKYLMSSAKDYPHFFGNLNRKS